LIQLKIGINFIVCSDFLSSNTQSVLLDKRSFLLLDLGLNRFAALIANKSGFIPLPINGEELKHLNQFCNKRCVIPIVLNM